MRILSTRHLLPVAMFLALPLVAARPAPATSSRMQRAAVPAPSAVIDTKSIDDSLLLGEKLTGGSAPDTEPDSQGGRGMDLVTATTYPMTALSGVALDDMSTGTLQLVAPNLDDTASAVTNIGFEFWYDGVRFTQFSVNANGLCRLGAVAVSTAFDNVTGFAAVTNAPKIAPYFDDLWTGTNGKVHFKVTGSAPNRKLIVEWLNVQIPRVAAGSLGAGTFQLWLFETTGVMEFVYGNGIALNAVNGGYSIGLQSGVATNFASVSSSTNGVSYTVANNTQPSAIAAGTAYFFTPNTPADPTGLNFTGTTAVATTLNWTDNASNEAGYAIYRSIDGGVNYSFLAQTAANAITFSDSGLLANTLYFYQVRAFSEGALSGPATGSVTTLPAVINSSLGSGNWSNPATWSANVIPGMGDAVTIADGHTVTIDIAATAYSLNVGVGNVPAILVFEPAIARTLTVGSNVIIAGNGSFLSAASGTVTTHVLSVGGNLANNGILDFSTNANTAGAGITFTGANNNSFGGSGITNNIRAITINKGVSSANILELNPVRFSVQGAFTDVAGYLTLTNGTFKISGVFGLVNRTFTTATYVIPATGGIWLNNPSYTVAATVSAAATANSGLFRITLGTYNIGVGTLDQMRGNAGAVFLIEGGTVNVSGAFDPQNAVTYTQSAGTMNVGVVGNTQSAFGTFELFSTTSVFTMSGGVINLVQASTAATPVDFQVRSGTINVTGGVVNVGTAATATNFNFRFRANTPNLAIDNTINAKTATFTAQTLLRGSVIVNPGTTFAINGFLVAPMGPTFTNNGTVTGNVTNSRFYFLGPAPITYQGSGVAGTAAAPLLSVDVDTAGGLTIDPGAVNLVTNRIILFSGNVVNASRLTLGSGGASTGVVQIGNTTTPTAAGTLDSPPVFNLGTGGEVISYLRTAATRITGNEINPARALFSMTYDDNDPTHTLAVAGGDLTLTNAAAALTMTNGRVVTGANSIILSLDTATVVRTNGYVDGALRKNFAVPANKVFEVGTATGYSPVSINVGTGTGDVTVRSQAGKLPALSGHNAINRYWTLTGAAGFTADLTFQYLLADVNGNEANYGVLKYDAGVLSVPPGQSVNPIAHTGTAPGVTSFSDWTVGELPVSLFRNGSLISLSPDSATKDAIFPNTPSEPAMAAADLEQALFFSTASFPNASQDYSDTNRIIIFYQTNTSGSNTLRVAKDTVGNKIVISY